MIRFIPGFCLRNKVAIENVANGIALGNVAKVDGFVKSPSAALPPCDARRQELHSCPVKCSLWEAEEANVRVSGFELPISENSLFNGVNHCGVHVKYTSFRRICAPCN